MQAINKELGYMECRQTGKYYAKCKAYKGRPITHGHIKCAECLWQGCGQGYIRLNYVYSVWYIYMGIPMDIMIHNYYPS